MMQGPSKGSFRKENITPAFLTHQNLLRYDWTVNFVCSKKEYKRCGYNLICHLRQLFIMKITGNAIAE